MKNKNFFIKSFGCQMNEYDSNKIVQLMNTIEYDQTDNPDEAECFIFNTCHIREKANQKVYSDIGKIKKNFRLKKKPIFVLAGCVAQAESNIVFEKSDYIDIVVGPQSYHKLPELINSFKSNKKKIVNTDLDVDEKFSVLDQFKHYKSKVSNFITIQEGCDKFCKFCVVPYTRGPEFSRSSESIIQEVSKLSATGTKEIILLGQNVSSYNYRDTSLAKLINMISENPEIERIRFTTSHPNDFDEELINMFGENEKLMPQIHLPAQSGSDKILKYMNRNYTKKKYLDLIAKFLSINPNIEFSSDFIVGYPGETEDDFNETLDLIHQVKFSTSYSFIYSQRPGTPAVNQDQLSPEVCENRLKILQDALFDYQLAFNTQRVGKIEKVLFENLTQNGEQFFGRNEHMIPVFTKKDGINSGDIKKVVIKDCNKNNLFGILA